MGVSNIVEKMCENYEIELSTSVISIITNKALGMTEPSFKTFPSNDALKRLFIFYLWKLRRNVHNLFLTRD